MYKILLISCLLGLPWMGFAQEKPDWVLAYGEGICHPTEQYRGFGVGQVSARMPRDRALQQARTQAQAHLAQSIRTQVTNREVEQVVERDAGFYTSFQSVTERTTEIELPGMSEKTWFDVTQNTWYVLGCLSKTDLHSRYRLKTASLKAEVRTQYNRSRTFLRSGKSEQALSAYFVGQTLLRRYQEAALIAALSAPASKQNLLDPSPNAQFRRLWSELAPKGLRVTGIDAAAMQLLSLLKEQTEGLNRPSALHVQFLPLRTGKTQQISSFAAHFADVLRHKAVSLVQWHPLESDDMNDSLEVSARFVLSGKLVIEGKEVRLMAYLQQPNRKWVAAAEVLIPLSVISQAGFSVGGSQTNLLEPDDKNTYQGIFLDAWTTKGKQAIVLRAGEGIRVLANVNRPAFLRLVYHLADGQKLLLLDNHYVRINQVNVPYEVPKDLIAHAPFGVEYLQVLAATEPFLPAETAIVDGLTFIKAPVSSYLQPVNRRSVPTAEVLIPITTLAK